MSAKVDSPLQSECHPPNNPALVARASKLADDVHKDGHAYLAFGAIDAGVLSLSLLKFTFKDILAEGSETLYDWMLTPVGMISSIALVAPLTAFSAFANYFSNSKDAFSKQLYRNWQMSRDGIKGFRNTFRGIDNAIKATALLSSYDLRYILLPTGLCLGIFSLVNRLCNRHFIINPRKDIKDHNDGLINAMDRWGTLSRFEGKPDEAMLLSNKNSFYLDVSEIPEILEDEEEATEEAKLPGLYYIDHTGKSIPILLNQKQLGLIMRELGEKKIVHPSISDWFHIIPEQASNHFHDFTQHIANKINQGNFTDSQKQKAYLSAVAGAVFDALYMFLGIIALSALSPYALVFVAVVSVCFSLLCVFTRVHEEKDYQVDLTLTQQKAELALCAKELDFLLAEYRRLKAVLATLDPDINAKEYETLQLEAENVDFTLQAKFSELKSIRERIFAAAKISTSDAVMIGLRHGVSAYIALLAAVFAASVISIVFFATPLPQIVVLYTVAAGIALLAGFTYHALCCASASAAHYDKQAKQGLATLDDYIKELKEQATEKLFEGLPELKSVEDAEGNKIYNLALASTLPVWHLLSWADIIRSTFSGLAKGPKLIGFLTSLLGSGDSSDYASPMAGFALGFILVASAFIFAATYMLRGLGKYRKDLDDPHPLYDMLTGFFYGKNSENTSSSDTELEVANEGNKDQADDTKKTAAQDDDKTLCVDTHLANKAPIRRHSLQGPNTPVSESLEKHITANLSPAKVYSEKNINQRARLFDRIPEEDSDPEQTEVPSFCRADSHNELLRFHRDPRFFPVVNDNGEKPEAGHTNLYLSQLRVAPDLRSGSCTSSVGNTHEMSENLRLSPQVTHSNTEQADLVVGL